jgi:hypothetical protein
MASPQNLETLLKLLKSIITREVGIPKALTQFYENLGLLCSCCEKHKDVLRVLERIVVMIAADLFDCREQYHNCLKTLSGETRTLVEKFLERIDWTWLHKHTTSRSEICETATYILNTIASTKTEPKMHKMVPEKPEQAPKKHKEEWKKPVVRSHMEVQEGPGADAVNFLLKIAADSERLKRLVANMIVFIVDTGDIQDYMRKNTDAHLDPKKLEKQIQHLQTRIQEDSFAEPSEAGESKLLKEKWDTIKPCLEAIFSKYVLDSSQQRYSIAGLLQHNLHYCIHRHDVRPKPMHLCTFDRRMCIDV